MSSSWLPNATYITATVKQFLRKWNKYWLLEIDRTQKYSHFSVLKNWNFRSQAEFEPTKGKMNFDVLLWRTNIGPQRPSYWLALLMTSTSKNYRIDSIYSDSQKHESSCLLSDCFSCIISGTTWAKKVIYIYLHPCLKSFQMKKRIFQIRLQNQLIFAKKRCFDRKK